MTTITKEWRVIAIEDNLIKEINRFKKNLYFKNPNITYDRVQESIYDYFHHELGIPENEVIEGMKMLSNNQKRRTRCLEKTKTLVMDNKNVYFGTLTFTNEVLETTSVETRRKYVSRYLKAISPCYIANIDYGDKEKNPDSNEREHYHCLIACDSVPGSWQYGFCKFLSIPKQEEDMKKISKYIAKLTNHAMKVERTGKAKRIIYSRGCPIPYWLLEEEE